MKKPKSVLRDFIVQVLWVLSETEAIFSRPNDFLRFRKMYLRAMKIRFGEKIWIGKNLRLFNQGDLILGERCSLGTNVRIENWSLIRIGDDFTAGPGLHLNSGGHDPASMEPKCLPITIGNRVWCGIDVTIISGVFIGDDVVIGAGSVVVSDIPSNSVAAGVPARVKKPLDREPGNLWTWATDKKTSGSGGSAQD